jgi:Fe2+ transport system protein FeoA
MFHQFTVSGAALQVLNVGDRGMITRFIQDDPLTLSHLESLGLVRGKAIAVTQRHPDFIVSTESGYLTLSPSLVSAIYVRLAG